MADNRAELRSKTKVRASIRQATGAAGAKQHSQLSGRDVPDQHPMSAITGLVSALAKKSDGLEITAEGLVYLTSDGERVAGPYELFSQGDGEHSGPVYVASDEPPEDTDALWVNTSEPEASIALGVTAEETANGVDIYATDELGTKKVSLRHGKDGAPGAQGPAGPQGEAGPAGPQGAPGADYELTDEDMQEIAGMVPGDSDKWEYIGEFSVDADVESWIITEDADGKPIELRRMYFEATFEGADGATDYAHLQISNPAYPSPWGANRIYCSIPAGLRTTRCKNSVWADYIPAGDGYEIVAHYSPSAHNLSWGHGIAPGNAYGKYIGGVAFRTADATKAKIGAGSTVKIWGVRM